MRRFSRSAVAVLIPNLIGLRCRQVCRQVIDMRTEPWQWPHDVRTAFRIVTHRIRAMQHTRFD